MRPRQDRAEPFSTLEQLMLTSYAHRRSYSSDGALAEALPWVDGASGFDARWAAHGREVIDRWPHRGKALLAAFGEPS